MVYRLEEDVSPLKEGGDRLSVWVLRACSYKAKAEGWHQGLCPPSSSRGFLCFCLFDRPGSFLLQQSQGIFMVFVFSSGTGFSFFRQSHRQKTVSMSILLIPYEKKVWLVTLDGKKDETPAFSQKKSVNLQIQNTIEFLYLYARP